jgi:hypothetical protein
MHWRLTKDDEINRYSQLQHHAHLFVELVRVIQLDNFRMLQSVHHVQLALDIFALLSVGHGNEFGRETLASRLLPALVNGPELAPSKQKRKRAVKHTAQWPSRALAFLPSDFLAEVVVLFYVYAALHAHLTIGKLRFNICRRESEKGKKHNKNRL